MRTLALLVFTVISINYTAEKAQAVDPNGGIFFSPPVTYQGWVYPGFYYTVPTFYYPPATYYLSYNPYFYPSYYYTPTYYPYYSYPTYYYKYGN